MEGEFIFIALTSFYQGSLRSGQKKADFSAFYIQILVFLFYRNILQGFNHELPEFLNRSDIYSLYW